MFCIGDLSCGLLVFVAGPYNDSSKVVDNDLLSQQKLLFLMNSNDVKLSKMENTILLGKIIDVRCLSCSRY